MANRRLHSDRIDQSENVIYFLLLLLHNFDSQRSRNWEGERTRSKREKLVKKVRYNFHPFFYVINVIAVVFKLFMHAWSSTVSHRLSTTKLSIYQSTSCRNKNYCRDYRHFPSYFLIQDITHTQLVTTEFKREKKNHVSINMGFIFGDKLIRQTPSSQKSEVNELKKILKRTSRRRGLKRIKRIQK